MPRNDYQLDEISDLGEKIYRERIKSQLPPSEKGKFVIIDVVSGDYEIAEEILTASDRLRKRRPDAVSYGVKVGYKAALHFGGSHTPDDD